jgi:hypothetical protein
VLPLPHLKYPTNTTGSRFDAMIPWIEPCQWPLPRVWKLSWRFRDSMARDIDESGKQAQRVREVAF